MMPRRTVPRNATALNRIRADYFSSWPNGAVTLVVLALLLWFLLRVLDWGVFEAHWATPAAECKATTGACWSVIAARWRLILFGLYPYEAQWRSGLACVVVIAAIIAVCLPRNWAAGRMSLILLGAFVLFFGFMRGGVLGLEMIPPSRWGGLSLTLFIYLTVITFGLPISILLAIGRQSRYPVIRGILTLVIDVTRSLPLITILFSAALIVPLVLPSILQGDKLTRVLGAFAFFFGCYQSENVRAGMQALPAGQGEAAEALGLTYAQRMRMIILPQAFRISMPATINQFVITFKETSLVVIVGLFDLMASARAAYNTGEWAPYYAETYIFVGLIYFAGAFSLSRYGAYLERRMALQER